MKCKYDVLFVKCFHVSKYIVINVEIPSDVTLLYFLLFMSIGAEHNYETKGIVVVILYIRVCLSLTGEDESRDMNYMYWLDL